ESGEDYVKLLDFGISKVLDQDTDSITQSDVPVGTPYYMAPEQASGEVSDHRVDIFSVGVILYEIMVGKRPFVDEDSRAIMYKSTTAAPQSPRRINPAIPKAIEKIILKALGRDPHKRFSSAEEMRKSLERSVPSSLWTKEIKGTADITVQDLSKSSLLIPRIPIVEESENHLERYGTYYLVAALFIAVLIVVGLWLFR
ncbi:MAG: serine/threonine protein kinase, partial [Proteobacteria bacterium]|nr:serine/threonine protein kinase [Pseudomonadota bacterium]